MKKIIIVCSLLLTVVCFAQNKQKVKGSKIVKIEQKQIDEFETLEVQDNLDISLFKGSQSAVEIEADDNLIPFVECTLEGKNLKISTSKAISSYKKLSVRVTYTDNFNMLIAKDETNITVLADLILDTITFKCYDNTKLFLNAKTKNFVLLANDKTKTELNLKSEKTRIETSKNAQLKALVSSDEMKFDMYQKSFAELEGDVIDLKLRLDNNTDFTGRKLTAKNATLEVGGYTKTSIIVSENLSIDASGDSEIELYGNPLKIEIKNFKDTSTLRKKQIKK